METGIAAAFLILSAAGIGLLLYAGYLGRIAKRLEKMINDAFDGKAGEERYDESGLSRLENRMNAFLASSAMGRNKVEEEKKKLEELISDISHQTRTPITTMKIYAGLLLERNLDEESADMVRRIEEQNDRLAFLIGNLVKTSRLENGIVAVHPAGQKLGILMERLRSVYENGEKPIFFPEKEEEEAYACYDPKWTAEAAANIIENAVKYTGEDGVVHIRIRSYDMFAAIEIEDNGIGIGEDEQPKIFSRFYRSEEVKDKKGVGLGLYLAQQIIQLQGGYISVVSSRGMGSVFRIFLPKE